MKINFLSMDLIALGYVSGIPEIEESKGFGRGKLNPNDLTITVKNYDDQFSADNPRSILSGLYWQFKPITFYDDDDNLVFRGIVTNIERDHTNKSANILCRDVMFQVRKTPIEYTSSDWETPATAALNMMIAQGFTAYDSTTVQASIAQLTAALCKVKVTIYKSDNLSLLNALELCGQYACADVYSKANKINFQHWQPYAGGVSIYFDYGVKSKRPLSAPVVTTEETTMFNSYTIGYDGDGGTPATDAANGNIGATSRTAFETQEIPEMRADMSASNRVVFKDLASAVYIGESYIKRGHSALSPVARVLQKVSFAVDYSYYRYVELGSYFKMTFSEEGWVDKVFEVSSIKRNPDTRIISLEAWEVVV